MTAKEEEELQLIEDWHLGAHHCDDEGFGCEIEEFEGNGPGAVGKYFRCKLERESYQSLRNTLSQQHEREIAEAKASLVDDLITMTKQFWDARSPFAIPENINNQMMVATSQVLLTMKERLKVDLEQQSNGGEIK